MSDAEKKEILEKEKDQELDENALNEVSGGEECVCILGGGGNPNELGTACACVAGGGGEWNDKGKEKFGKRDRCVCVGIGVGNGLI